MRSPTLTLLLLFAALGGASALAEEEWTRPYAPYLPGTEPLDEEGERTVVAIRLLLGSESRAAELRPLAGAWVRCHEENSHASSPGARLLAEARTDEYGFANIQGPCEDGYHWHFDAPGLGIAHEYSSFAALDEEFYVGPGGDVTFRVLDPFGRPLPEARVEYYLGCPHSPTARSGVSDGNGVITLTGLHGGRYGRLWVLGRGISAGPYGLPERHVREPLLDEEDGPAALITDPARTAVGEVRDAEGRPLPGAVVRALSFARGPATVTDERGRFVLHGVTGKRSILFYHPDPLSREVPGCTVRAFHEEVPLRIVLRPDRASAMAEGEPHYPVTVLPGTAGTPVRLTRLSDGYTVSGKTGEGLAGTSAHHLECIFAADLPAGTYRAEAGGGFSGASLATATIRVPVPDGAPVRLETARQPELWIADADRSWKSPASLRIRGEETTDKAFLLSGSARLPGEGPAWLLFRWPRPYLVSVGERSDRLYDIPKDHRPAYPIPPEPHRLRFRIRSARVAAITPYAFSPWYPDPELRKVEDGVWEHETHRAGPFSITLTAESHQPQTIELDLPGLEGRIIDGGEVMLHPLVAREFVLRTASGEPIKGLASYETDGSTDDEGRVKVLVGPAEAEYAFWHENCATRIVRLSTKTPGRLVLPDGRVRLRVLGAEDEPLEAMAYVDAWRVPAPAGTCEFGGLAPGAHTVIVGARNHLGEVIRIVLAADEEREITVRLPLR